MTNDPKNQEDQLLTKISWLIFAIILAFMTYVAWHNSQPASCPNHDIQYKGSTEVCVVPLQNFNTEVEAK